MNEPDAVVTEIARNAGVVASLLHRWRRQLAAERETTAFVPVRVFSELNEAGPTTAPIGASPTAAAVEFDHGRFRRACAADDRGRAQNRATLANVIGALTAPGSAPAMMFAFPSGTGCGCTTGHTDMRKGFGSLALMVQEGFKRDPHATIFWDLQSSGET